MQSLFEALSSVSLVAHGDALRWQQGLVWVHAVAHGVIALAFLAMVPSLLTLVRRRNGTLPGWMPGVFGLFLVASIALNLIAIWTLWSPAYWLENLAKVVTALAAVATAYAVSRLLSPDAPAAVAPTPVLEGAEDRGPLVDRLQDERDAAIAGLATEIARREKAEAALMESQKLEAVGQLTGGVAHDFNNLLQAVAGNLELIARKPDDADRVVRWSAAALDAVQRGRAVTGQLLAFARKQRVQVTSVRLVALVAGMRDLLERAVAPLGQVEIHPIDPTLNVQTDALQLELAMLNLAFTARDAMPDGGVLHISAERRSAAPGLPPGDYVALSLSSSVGTIAADAPGLSMAKGVLGQTGGALAVEDGDDARVLLFLRVTTAEPTREMQDDAAGDERIDLGGCTVTVVDDDSRVRAILVETLVSAGAQVSEASSGGEGIELVQRASPDVLVVDFGMPGMSGGEVVRKVRALYPDMPVLLVSGLAELAAVAAVRGPGVGVLQKPFEAQQLLREVKILLDR